MYYFRSDILESVLVFEYHSSYVEAACAEILIL